MCLTPVGWNSKGHLTAISSPASVGGPTLLVNRWHAAEEQSLHCGQTKTDVEVNTFQASRKSKEAGTKSWDWWLAMNTGKEPTKMNL